MQVARNAKSIHAARGFTLIEILVTVLIMGIALLGLAGMQSVGLQQSQATYFRTQADLLARDLADRMRANRNGAAPENVDGQRYPANGFYRYTGAVIGTACAPGADCTPEQIAQQDLSEWGDEVRRLPNGSARVLPGARFWRISIFWDERRNGATGLGCDPHDEDDMACLYLYVEI